jgi:hypothetical protein
VLLFIRVSFIVSPSIHIQEEEEAVEPWHIRDKYHDGTQFEDNNLTDPVVSVWFSEP